jgi:hypothetical protein
VAVRHDGTSVVRWETGTIAGTAGINGGSTIILVSMISIEIVAKFLICREEKKRQMKKLR